MDKQNSIIISATIILITICSCSTITSIEINKPIDDINNAIENAREETKAKNSILSLTFNVKNISTIDSSNTKIEFVDIPSFYPDNVRKAREIMINQELKKFENSRSIEQQKKNPLISSGLFFLNTGLMTNYKYGNNVFIELDNKSKSKFETLALYLGFLDLFASSALLTSMISDSIKRTDNTTYIRDFSLISLMGIKMTSLFMLFDNNPEIFHNSMIKTKYEWKEEWLRVFTNP